MTAILPRLKGDQDISCWWLMAIGFIPRQQGRWLCWNSPGRGPDKVVVPQESLIWIPICHCTSLCFTEPRQCPLLWIWEYSGRVFVFLLLPVCLRSFVGMQISFIWKNNRVNEPHADLQVIAWWSSALHCKAEFHKMFHASLYNKGFCICPEVNMGYSTMQDGKLSCVWFNSVGWIFSNPSIAGLRPICLKKSNLQILWDVTSFKLNQQTKK